MEQGPSRQRCLLLLLSLSFLLANHGLTNAGLCDFTVGAGTNLYYPLINETDTRDDYYQEFELPIEGELDCPDPTAPGCITLTSETDICNDRYGIIYFKNNAGQNRFAVTNSVDRDGPTPEPGDDIPLIECTLQCLHYINGLPNSPYRLLALNIFDVNDNGPNFQNEPYTVTFSEAFPIGSSVYAEILATDRDSNENKRIFYSILDSPGSPNFRLNDESLGSVLLRSQVDYETLVLSMGSLQPTFTIPIQARDDAIDVNARLTATATLTVTITDADDMQPTFVHPGCLNSQSVLNITCDSVTYEGNLFSGTSQGLASFTNGLTAKVGDQSLGLQMIEAVDQDYLNAPINFRIFSASPATAQGRFSLSPPTVVRRNLRDYYQTILTQTGPVFREDGTEIKLYIIAEQVNATYRYDFATVTLNVLPVNVNPPVLNTQTGSSLGYIFENSPINTVVRANSQGNSPLLKFIATDPDLAPGDTQNYIYQVVEAGVPFTVTSDGYLVNTVADLDRETVPSYSFSVTVTEDLGSGSLTSNPLLVRVDLLDVNDNNPVFDTAPNGFYFSQRVEGNYASSPEFLQFVTATDQDAGANGQISYSISNVLLDNNRVSSAIVQNYFTINDTGAVFFRGDGVFGDRFTVSLLASNPPPSSRTGEAILVLEITSTGQNAPVFPVTSRTVYVSEGTGAGTPILTVMATDIEDQMISQYDIISGNVQNDFVIDSSGIITLTTATPFPLDYESIQQYTLIIQARDSTTLTGTSTVTVSVLNENDNSPSMNTQYTFSVTEEQPGGTFVGTIDNISDADGTTTFFFTLSGTTLFTINQNSGEIRTLAPLNFEAQRQHTFIVRVNDGGASPRTTTARVIVNVNDIDDNLPLFSEAVYEASVQEGSAGLPVITITATDADEVQQINYRIINEPTNSFTINPSTGQITTAVALNYDLRQQYEFTITTQEGENSVDPKTRAIVRVTVLDMNNHVPTLTISASSVSIAEDFVEYTARAGSPVLPVTLTATDADPPNTENSRLTYAITSVSPTEYSDNFIINPATGEVRVVLSFVGTTVTTLTVNVQVSDNGFPRQTNTGSFQVTILRNRQPTFSPVTSDSTSFNFNLATNSLIYSYTVTDPDTTPARFGQMSDTLIGDSDAQSYFYVQRSVTDNNLLEVRIRQSLAGTTDSEFLLRIETADNINGGVINRAVFPLRVSVNRNLNDPQWASTVTDPVPLSENSEIATTVTRISIQDNDLQAPYNVMECSLTGDQTAADVFSVETNNNFCDLILKRSPAAYATNLYTVTLALRDLGTPNSRSAPPLTFGVEILRNNEPPMFFLTEYFAEISEEDPPQTVVQLISASDADTEPQNRQLTFSIIGDDVDGLFALGPPLGNNEINVVTIGDFTQTAQVNYVVRVEARDGGVNERTAVALVRVKVLRNLRNPVFDTITDQTVRIPETQPQGVAFATVTANDLDRYPPNNQVMYNITTESEYFAVYNTGGIYAKKDLRLIFGADTREFQIFQLLIQAIDMGDPPRQSQNLKRVTVTVFNNRAPFFTSTSLTRDLPENTTAGTTVVSFNYQDPDTLNMPGIFDILSTAIVTPLTASSFFELRNDNNQPSLVTISTLFQSPVDEWTIVLQVRDQEDLFSLLPITVRVNRNLNAPRITQSTLSASVLEVRQPGFLFGQRVIVEDLDRSSPSNTYTVEIVNSVPTTGLNLFDISTDGQLFVKGRLSQSTGGPFELRIQATDRGTPPLRSNQIVYTVTVLRNLHRPIFQNLPLSQPFSLARNTPNGQVFFTANATDADTQTEFNTITYSIIQGNAGNLFSINPSSGGIAITSNLATASLASYELLIMAMDNGDPGLFDVQPFRLTVNNNEFPPVIVSPGATNNFRVFVPTRETVPQTETIYNLEASDSDPSPPFNEYKFEITNNTAVEAQTYFMIVDRGSIRIRSSLLLTTQREFVLYAIARDGGNTPSINTATVTISVNRNDFTPQYVAAPYTIDVEYLENVINQNVLAQVRATDQDSIYGQVRFQLIGDGEIQSYFTIDEITGEIRLAQALTPLRTPLHFLRVRAYDNGVPPKENITVITVNLGLNLREPEFNATTISVFISEDEPVGTSLGQVFAFDNDPQAPNNVVTYKISDADVVGRTYFAIHPTTGVFTINRDLGDDTATVYLVTIEANDGGTPSLGTTTTATVRVYRNNQSPTFSPVPAVLRIPSTTAVGTIIYTFVYNDIDVDAPFGRADVVLSSPGTVSANTYFQLSPSGEVTVIRGLLDETNFIYTLQAVARDGGNPPRTGTAFLRIEVLHNLNPPVFNADSCSREINEDFLTSQTIATLIAEDSDEPPYNVVSYRIDPADTVANEYFMIDTSVTLRQGILTLRKPLREDTTIPTRTSYTFNVYAYDNDGRQSAPKQCTITTYRNNQRPSFRLPDYTVTINETHQVNTLVFNLGSEVTDNDRTPFNVQRFALIEDAEAFQYFLVNPSTGEITLAASVFNIQTNTFRLVVQAEDGGVNTLSDFTTVIVNIRRNFFAPVSQGDRQFEVFEHNRAGTVIGTVIARDDDIKSPYNQVIYSIQSSIVNLPFQIDSATGTLSLAYMPLDTLNFYSILIATQDGAGLQGATIRANITIVRNENDPIISIPERTKTILSTTPVNSLVTQVAASDADTRSPYNQYGFFLYGDGLATQYFRVESNTGRVLVSQNLGGAPTRNFTLLLVAADGSSTERLQRRPYRETYGVVQVQVVDVAVRPEFIPAVYSRTGLLEDQELGVVLETVILIDPDSNDVSMRLATPSDYFMIAAGNTIILKKPLSDDPTNATQYQLTIVGEDGTGQPAVNQATVTFSNILRNNNSPRFTNLPYNPSINRNALQGSFVQRITTEDFDSGIYGQTTVTIEDVAEVTDLFGLSGSDLVVRNASLLAANAKSNHRVRLRVTDGGGLFTLATVNITVRQNLLAPRLPDRTVVEVFENVQPGYLIYKVTGQDDDPRVGDFCKHSYCRCTFY